MIELKALTNVMREGTRRSIGGGKVSSISATKAAPCRMEVNWDAKSEETFREIILKQFLARS